MIDTKAIRKAAEAATPGPWECRQVEWGNYVTADGQTSVCQGAISNTASMIHIATANPATILELLDRLEAAEKDAARIRNAALEEAAVKCEEIDFSYSACEQFVSGEAAFECGKQIRSMKK